MRQGYLPGSLRRQSVRVALGAAAIVAIVYLVISVAAVGIVSADLTRQVDDRLHTVLSNEAATGGTNVSDDAGRAADDSRAGGDDRQFGAPVLIWRVDSVGTATYLGPASYAVDLPAAYASISAPQTITINGSSLRMDGLQVGPYYFLAAQSLTSLGDAQTTLILAEVLIAPFLLLAVFLGAVVIGRRVAAPIELARQRQLEFTADASHELRTPLSVIEAHTSLGLTRQRDNEWYRSTFERIDAESQRMRQLLDDLLWLARFDVTQKPVNSEPVDVGVLGEAAAARFSAVAEARRLSLELHVPAQGAVISAPPEWLDRLTGVLLDNACKYSPDGGSVALTVILERGRVTLSVDDSGPGIPESERSRVFDRFHRATDERSGAGLGLAIGDAIVRATDGQWRIGTSPWGGARMSVSWPSTLPGSHEAVGGPSRRGIPQEGATRS